MAIKVAKKVPFVLLIAFLAAISSSLVDEECHPRICTPCLSKKVKCVTNNQSEPIPQYLNPKISTLDVKFNSPESRPVELQLNDMKRYQHLSTLHLEGDFAAIADDAMSFLPKLRNFHLTDTHIALLPDKLLAQCGRLGQLDFKRNQFTKIPLNILASGPVDITRFTFNGHPTTGLPCLNNSLSLPPAFGNMTILEILDLKNSTFDNPNCSTAISERFLVPVSRVLDLIIAGTNLADKIIGSLQLLERLKSLDISNSLSFKSCPSDAISLFTSIPTTVKHLLISGWETTKVVSEDCVVNGSTLAHLMELPLERLSFAYSDGIFGPVFSRKSFPKKIYSLKRLDLTSCRVNEMEIDALAEYHRLDHLVLTGNPLGPKNLRFASQPLINMRILTLANTGIRSDSTFNYEISQILCSFPELIEISFSSNALTHLPTFNRTSKCNLNAYNNMKKVSVDLNLLEDFTQSGGSGSDNICVTFPRLSELIMSTNKLRNMDGLEKCSHLETLILDHNQLSYGNNHNSSNLAKLFSQLKNLRTVDLSFNSFRQLNPNLLAGMVNLRVFRFHANNLETIDPGLFKHNTRMEEIDLTHNYLKSIDPSLFENLLYLKNLHIQDNKIASFSAKFLHAIDKLQHLMFFGISDNPYECGCDKTFQNWLIKSSIERSSLPYIRCGNPQQKTKLVYNYKENTFECHIKNVIIISGSICSGFLLTLAVALPCYKYRWYIKHARVVWKALVGSLQVVKMEHVCLYDAYVSFDQKCQDDARWVVEELIPAIEGVECSTSDDSSAHGLNKYKLYLESRDSLGGTHKFIEREVALTKSKRILIIVSNSYLKSADCLSEAELTGLQMHGTEFYQPNRVMLLIREDLSEEIIRPPMTSLLLGKTLQVERIERRKRAMWRKIRQFLSEPLYYYSKSDRSSNGNSTSGNEYTDAMETTPLLSSVS